MNKSGKVDCFANKSNLVRDESRLKKDGCNALSETVCLTRECPFYKTKERCLKLSYPNMTFGDVQDSVNQWLLDKEERTYFWILGTDRGTKTIDVKGLGGIETRLFFSPGRILACAKSIENGGIL